MNIKTGIDKSYFLSMNKKKRYMDSMLLMELLYQTYCYSGNEYDNMSCDKLLKKMIKIKSYTMRDLNLIKQHAVRLLKIKYNVNVSSIEPLVFNKFI